MAASKNSKAEGLIDKLGGRIQKETGKATGDRDQIEKGEKDLAKGERKSNSGNHGKA